MLECGVPINKQPCGSRSWYRRPPGIGFSAGECLSPADGGFILLSSVLERAAKCAAPHSGRERARAIVDKLMNLDSTPEPPERASHALETVIVTRVREIVDGFKVRRALPSARRRMVGPFVFLDQMGPEVLGAGRGAAPAHRARHRDLPLSG